MRQKRFIYLFYFFIPPCRLTDAGTTALVSPSPTSEQGTPGKLIFFEQFTILFPRIIRFFYLCGADLPVRRSVTLFVRSAYEVSRTKC